MVKKIELLAPAQNKECAMAAIDYGADAVYIGAESFGARKNAANSIEDIKDIVNYAHLFYAKLYVTINTILTDEEIPKAQKLIEKLYTIGADGIIIQDMGLLKLDLPPVKLFASTQCNIRTPEKVRFFENIGMSRVILARELNINQIKEISDNTNIDIETFIHGALCVSYSGQCYLSCASGGRSANRGECAQSCRKKYTLVNEKGDVLVKDKHLLSLKDFMGAKHIDKLVEAGVSSFKIEGRLKNVDYIKNVTGYYRKLLDKYPKTSCGTVFFDFEPNVEKSFNRGFCDYFITGKRNKIHNFDTPKAIGEKIGIVKDKSKGKNTAWFTVLTNKELYSQDGLCFSSNGNFSGCLVNKAEIISRNLVKIYPNNPVTIELNTEIYRNNDVQFEYILRNSKTKRRIAVDFNIYKDYIEAVDENGYKIKAEFESSKPACNQEKMIASYRQALNKYGESNFFTRNIDFKEKIATFVPASFLNQARREIFEKLEQKRIKDYRRKMQKPVKPASFYLKEGDYRLNIHNKAAKEFMEECGCNIIENSLESTKDFKNKELMRCKYCIKDAINMCKSPEKLYLIDDKGKKLKLEFDCKNCEMIIKG